MRWQAIGKGCAHCPAREEATRCLKAPCRTMMLQSNFIQCIGNNVTSQVQDEECNSYRAWPGNFGRKCRHAALGELLTIL
jgi:hypothetical protein